MDETPTEPQPSRRRRRRSGRPGGQPQNPESAAPESPSDAAAGGAPETVPPEAAAVEDETAADADDYADSSAFRRFSGMLGIASLIVLAGALVMFSVQGALTRNVVVLLIVAALLGGLYVIPRWGDLVDWLRTRPARQGGNVTLASVAFIGLLAVGNWFVNRHSPQWDLTASQMYTLSDQSAKVLNGLQQDVKITAFFPSQQEDAYVRGTKDLLRQYDRRSDRVTVEFVDPDVNPGVARQFDISSYPVTIFQIGDRKEQTTGLTEQDFTSALLKLTRTDKKKVYFVQGHQERDPDNPQQPGYNAAAEALKAENYQVEDLTLLATQKVPDDASVVVVAGPRAPLLDPEKQALQDYLDRGGKVFFLVDPRQDTGLSDLLSSWYVQLDDDLVIDPGRNYLGDALSILPSPQSGHRITTSLPDLILPGTRSVTVKPGAGSAFAIVPLLRTTDRSWAEKNFTAAARQDADDTPGPLSVAVAVNKTDPTQAITPGMPPAPTPPAGAAQTPKGRIVVVGNSEFAANTYFGQVLGNRDFFVNSVNWLAEDEDLISIRATPAVAPPILLSNQAQVLVFYTSVVFVPLAVLLLGGVIWWQRR
jgi:ABC-type uncharacterized transport system involved in gliding motility auxiliary subunit